MVKDDPVEQFASDGKAAGFLLRSSSSVSAAYKRIDRCVSVYESHPQLQEAFDKEADRFSWNFFIELERHRCLAESERQQRPGR